MKTPRLVWDSKNEPQSTKPVSAYDRVRVVEGVDEEEGAIVRVTERWNGTSAMGDDQWRQMASDQAPSEMVRAIVRMADAEMDAKRVAGELDTEGLDAIYLAAEAQFVQRTRDYYRRIASSKPFEELRDPDFFKVSSQWSDAAWEARKRREDEGNPFADEPTAFADVPGPLALDTELPPVLGAELTCGLEVSEPTAHLETDERTDDEIPY